MTFEEKVTEFVVAGKTRGKAIRHVAANFPNLHDDFVARAGSTGSRPTIMAQPQAAFEGLVSQAMAGGKTRGQAIRHVAANFPDLHDDFVARAGSTGSRPTIMAQPQGSFDDLMTQVMAAGKTRGEAIRYLATNFPNLQ